MVLDGSRLRHLAALAQLHFGTAKLRGDLVRRDAVLGRKFSDLYQGGLALFGLRRPQLSVRHGDLGVECSGLRQEFLKCCYVQFRFGVREDL